jgi:hypothetical protein
VRLKVVASLKVTPRLEFADVCKTSLRKMSSWSFSGSESLLRMTVAVPVSVATLPIGSSEAADAGEAGEGVGEGEGDAAGRASGVGAQGRRQWCRLGLRQFCRTRIFVHGWRREGVLHGKGDRVNIGRARQHKATQKATQKPYRD